MTEHRSFENLFKTSLFHNLDKLCDAIVVGKDGVEFKGHKLFLSKGSGYFNSFFKGNFGDTNDTVNLPFDSNTLSTMLIFVYTGEVYLDDENIASIIAAADFLIIDTLLMKCRDYAMRKISLDCCLPLLILSNYIERLQIKEHCFRFVQVNFGRLVHKGNSDIEELSPNIFKDLISGNSLGVPDEDTVWKAIVIWVERDPTIRFKNVPELLSCIRWSEVSYLLASCVTVHPIFIDNEFCRGIRPEQFIRTSVNKFQESDTGRIPTKIHIFACTPPYISDREEARYGTTEIFLAYDDKLDYCRKIGEIVDEYVTSLVPIGRFIFLFNTLTNTMKAFDLITKMWHEKQSLNKQRFKGSILQCQNRLFVFGGYVVDGDDDLIPIFECYDLITDIWSTSSPGPFRWYMTVKACLLSNRLYVIAYEDGNAVNFRMVVYDPTFDIWSHVQKPTKTKNSCELINFHERLYIMGGRDHLGTANNTVEVYCPERNQWNDFPPLPFSYIRPKPVILEDKLIIYDSSRRRMQVSRFPPCSWNEETEAWDTENVFSPPYNEIDRYVFCCVDDTRTLKELSRENRDPETVWTKTPFELRKA